MQAIARAAAILRALESAPEGCGISEIAAATGLPKSTAHRIVAALADEDLVAHEGGACASAAPLPGSRRFASSTRSRRRSACGRPPRSVSSSPVHCTANGKALLATMTNAEIEALLPTRLERYTPSTIVSRARLLDELEAVRRTGVAFDREEHTEGIAAVGAALSEGGRAVAAISVPVPTQRFDGREMELAAAVRTAAEAGLDLFDRE